MSNRFRDILKKHYMLPEQSLGGEQDGLDRVGLLQDLETAAELSRNGTRILYASIIGAVLIAILVVWFLGQEKVLATALLASDGGLLAMLIHKLQDVLDKDTRTRMALVLARHADQQTIAQLIRISFDHYAEIGNPKKPN